MATDTPMTVLTFASTAVSTSWTTWSDNVLVDASANAATVFIYVATDGTTASATNFNYVMQGGQVAVVANRQPDLYGLEYAGNGGLNSKNGSGYGITAQSRPAALWTGAGTTGSGAPTFVSVFASAAATVGVEQR